MEDFLPTGFSTLEIPKCMLDKETGERLTPRTLKMNEMSDEDTSSCSTDNADIETHSMEEVFTSSDSSFDCDRDPSCRKEKEAQAAACRMITKRRSYMLNSINSPKARND